jgi:hypothetical protein
MNNAFKILLRWLAVIVGVLLAAALAGFVGVSDAALRTFGVSLFAAAIAWFAVKRTRTNAGAGPLPSGAADLVSIGMWAVSAATIVIGEALLGSSPTSAWLPLLSGVLAYVFGGWCTTLVDRREAAKGAASIATSKSDS